MFNIKNSMGSDASGATSMFSRATGNTRAHNNNAQAHQSSKSSRANSLAHASGSNSSRENESSKRLEKLSRSVFIGTFVTIASVAIAIISTLTSQAAIQEATGDTRAVIVTTQEIPAGTTITKEMVSEKIVPSAYIQDRTYSQATEIIGKTTASAISSNSQVSEYLLSDALNTSSLAAKLPAQKKAVSINVSTNNGVSNLLKCGNKVNVYSVNSSTQSMNKIAESVLVLALDTYLSGPAESVTYTTVTLQVSEEQSEKIIEAQANDQIFLTLNSASGNTTLENTGQQSSTLQIS